MTEEQFQEMKALFEQLESDLSAIAQANRNISIRLDVIEAALPQTRIFDHLMGVESHAQRN